MASHVDAGSSLGTLMATGCLLGFIHVLSGPDHLSALASLSVNGSFHSFCLGVQWGLGHSTGLILTALLFSTGWIDLGAFAKYGEPVVGIFMIVLGIYGCFRKEEHAHGAHGHRHGNPNHVACPSWRQAGAEAQGVELGRMSLAQESDEQEILLSNGDEGVGEARLRVGEEGSLAGEGNSLKRYKRCAALCVGIVHGIAGPGGVLGVMPAVVLNDRVKSSLYIVSFCVASIATMGVFAGCYGEVTARVGKAYNISKCLVLTSSAFAIIVGITWLVLLSLGKLDAFFP